MKKAVLFLVAAGAFSVIAFPVMAQKQVTLQEVTKATQQNQAAQQTAVNPAQTGQTANQAATQPAVAVPLTCTWDVVNYDFGKSPIQGKPASATFHITNAGKDPITITQVQPSCGCTSPKYTKEPIKPGESGEVVLTYDARVSGYFSKSAQVRLNDGQKYQLTIKGEVQKVEAPPANTNK